MTYHREADVATSEMAEVQGVRTRLRDGTMLSVGSQGLHATWFIGDNDFVHMLVEWEQIRCVRRIRLGNPFQPTRRRLEKHETGFLFVGESGQTFMLEADESDYAEAIASIQAQLGARWSELYSEEQVAVVHDGIDLRAPDSLRRPFQIVDDPRRIRPGAVIANEPPEVTRDRARPLLRRALFALAGGWLLSANGAMVAFLPAIFSTEVRILVGGPLLTLGAALVALFIICFVRWKREQPIVIHENGVFVPAQFFGIREQFIPFAYIVEIKSDYRRGVGKVFSLRSFPWVRPVEIPASFPKLTELIPARKGEVSG